MNRLKTFLVVSAGFTLLSVLGCASTTPYVEPPLPEGGTTVPGGNLTEKLAWLEKGTDSRNLYIVEVNADENIAPRTLEYSGATDVTIVIRGVGENRTIRLSEHGTMFTVKPNVELILDGNITLMGHSQNKGPIINVDGGKVWMRTGTNITGNENTGTTNILTTRSTGGGVYVGSGRFIMSGGTISGNTAEDGGGVFVANDRGIHEFEYVADDTSFCLYAGTISGNTADNGGGVYLYKASLMSYKNSIATITGNTARQRGGGLYVNRGRYEDWESMRKGSLIIAGVGRWNYASERYIKRGNDPYNGNAVKDEAGNIRGGYTGGHTMFWNSVSDGYPSLFSDETIGKWAKSNEQSDEQTEVSATATPASAPPATVAPAPAPPAAAAPKTPATAAPVQEQIVEQEQPVEQVQSREQVVVQQEQAASNIDPRLVGGSWWNGNKGGCTKWTFGDNGKGSVEYHCDVTPFGFTAVNGRITFFGKVQVCDEDGCEEVEMPGRNFSFLDDGKTLIIDRDRFTKGGPASCCPH